MSEHGPEFWTGNTGKRSVKAKEPTPKPAPPVEDEQPSTKEEAPAPPETAESGEATDAAKALAAEHGVDITTVQGSGSGGRVTQDDVKALLPDA
jgi:pyruvate dehydrogenase E2 component (dihydrolipoamide acetyltransferase)